MDPILRAAVARRELEMGERLLERAKGEGRAPAVAVPAFEVPALGRLRPRNAAPWSLLIVAAESAARPVLRLVVPEPPPILRRAETWFSLPYASTGRARQSLEVRFWAKVQKGEGDACWLWTAARGHFRSRRETWVPLIGVDRGDGKHYGAKNARVVAADLLGVRQRGERVGQCPRDALCVRPDHFLRRESAAPRKGERNFRSKVSDVDRAAALEAISRGESIRSVARRYDVSTQLLYGALAGLWWKHIARPEGLEVIAARIALRGKVVAAGKGRAA